ncbi:GNAT family N-acetyltransferase [Roseovarius sp. LXJ103]|uniref:GNAT family N-acetyltransferase n=1 Tax=Roseovarius carneus TaxID=2853164 RepID=UPI0015E7E547|nr:GNAT family N-acetyltransferase [Roseovarius carneus]MBZ8119881.1 GNAT family N-acetyltransferase [Roseovarius carneus]
MLTILCIAAKVRYHSVVRKNWENLITLRVYQSEDRTWVEESNVRFYRAVHNFDATFAVAVNSALDLLERQKSLVDSLYLVAEAEKQPVGCIFLCAETPAAGRIRLFYLEEEYRGRGIGLRLLRTVVSAAKDMKLKTVRVSTFDRHPEACRLYETFGFESVKTAPSTDFSQVMKQVDYELLLGGSDL